MIEGMRLLDYPGSDLEIEQDLENGANYTRQIVSYRSEGLKIFALLTVPLGEPPPTGWPVIVFNHGYIPPDEYRTTERYVAYVDLLARSGYIVFRPDYRGHGDSQGEALGAYGRPDYTIDVLNAVASVRRVAEADPERVGMWGHSMGGHITLRAMVTTRDIKAGVIWAGVVASYADLMTRWRSTPPATISGTARRWRSQFIADYGDPETNPEFWAAISPDSYLDDLSGPLQLHHAEGDETVPVLFSQLLYQKAQDTGAPVDLYLYPGDNHNINQNFSLAMQRTIEFFDRYLKE
jgi:dipeptidyl aminopeptidase/acylaminoacyl peptidase